jgi:Zn-dependent M28 family amino/carboxypeptidase
MRIGGSVARAIPLPLQVREHDELQIPVAVLSDKVANQIVGDAIALAKLQSAIDSDLKPRSQPIPNSTITIHDQNASRSTGTSYNVVGLLPGSDPTLKNETIIISAHHDHDGMSEGEIWHGADDNASGTAGVISLAHALSTNAHAPNGLPTKRSILFVVFAGEERGLLGAFYMAQHPLRPLATTRAMINFDMIGRNEEPSTQTNGLIDIPSDTTNRLNLIGGHYSPDYENTIRRQNKFVGLNLDTRFDNEAALNVFFRSDQFPFVLQNIPAFWWFTGFHRDYHQTSDTADKINYNKMQKILQLAYLSAYVFANETVSPKFIQNPGASTVIHKRVVANPT